MKDADGDGPWWKRAGPAADAGWTLSGSILGCLFIGYLLGEYFEAKQAGILIGLLVGIVVGFYNLAKIMWLRR